MNILLLVLGLLLTPHISRAQDTGVFSAPASPDMGLQPSAPDASAPALSEPVGVPQVNPEYRAEMDRREPDHRDDDIGHGMPIMAVPVVRGSKAVGKLRIAKMQKGPEIPKESWQKGRWFHGKHDGSFAWWWVVDTTWFRYSKYAYPFPDHGQRQVYLPHGGSSGSTSLSSVAPTHP